MSLDIANSDASSVTERVLVSFYLVATDNTSCSSARTSAIYKEKFSVPLSGDEHNNLFNVVKHLKTFIAFSKIANSKSLEKTRRSCRIATSCSFIILRYKSTLHVFAETFNNTHNFNF